MAESTCPEVMENRTGLKILDESRVEGGKQALSGSRRNSEGEALQAENHRLKQLIGELTIANDAFNKNSAGRERKIVADLIRAEGLSLRRALRLSSRRAFHFPAPFHSPRVV